MMLNGKIFNLLFPPKCILCSKVLGKGETDLCETCRTESPACTDTHKRFSFLDSWTAVWYYKGYIRKSIHRFKFCNARHYASSYGRLLAEKIMQEYPEGFDLLTWVPVSRIRRFTRGYDQVALLAKAVGRELGMTPRSTMVKIRHNRPQSGISGQTKRRANVQGAYRVKNPQEVSGKRILLLDDVITTGATAGECACVLRAAGAKEVHCGCIAAASQHE